MGRRRPFNMHFAAAALKCHPQAVELLVVVHVSSRQSIRQGVGGSPCRTHSSSSPPCPSAPPARSSRIASRTRGCERCCSALLEKHAV
eukprot:16442762-Heterocapsa_arctica.AAC.1